MADLPAPGIYTGLPYAVYASWDAMRSSVAKEFERTAAHGRAAMMSGGGKSTAAKELGTAAHLAILEPERLEKDVVVRPKADRRLKADGFVKGEFCLSEASILAWEQENAGKEWVSQGDLDHAKRIRDAVWRKPWAPALLGSKGVNEASILWMDPTFHLPCKVRPDRIVADYNGVTTIVSLKTAYDASPEAFNRARHRFGYEVQAAMEVEALDALSPHTHAMLWLVLETETAIEPALYYMTPELHSRGVQRFKGALAQHAEGLRNNYWPGYSVEPQPLDLLPWEKAKSGEVVSDADSVF